MTEWEQLQADIENVLQDVDSLSVEEIAEAVERDYNITLEALQALKWVERVRKIEHDDGRVSYGLPLPEEPETVEPPVPQGPPPRRAPIFRGKRNFPMFPDSDISDRFLG